MKLPIFYKVENSDRQERRERIAQIIAAMANRVRRRIRGKLNWRSMQGGRDVDDVFASAWRRIDDMAARGKLQGISAEQLEGLVVTISRRIAVDSARAERRHKRVVHRLAPRAGDGFASGHADELAQELLARSKPQHRLILELWARGISHTQIATELGLSVAAYRTRWTRLWIEITPPPT